MSEEKRPVRYEPEGEIAVISIDNPPVNACSQAVRQGLVDAMERFAAGPEKVAVIYGVGRTFVAGADIKEFGKAPLEPFLPDLIDGIEAQEKPVVCVLHGTTLGGGLEIALGAHYRVALRSARLGLPEVNLGVIPGAGGTQRLPRLIGLMPAAGIFTSARQVPAEEALELGIVDALSEEEPRVAGLNFAARILARGDGPRRIRDLPGPKVDAEAVAELRAKVARANRGEIAQLAGLDVAVKGAGLSFDDALAAERAAFFELMESPQRTALIHAFFAERKVARLPELAGVKGRAVGHLGVIGGGTMGAGIAVAGLLNGLSVTLIERDAAAAAKARDGIARTLSDSVRRGKLEAERRETLLSDALVTSDDYAALAQADVIVEAVFESMEVKREVFGKLDAVAKPGAVLATNTSYLDVNQIAQATARPADVLGLHFFSPAHVMRLLEIVVADATAPEVTATGFALARALGKVPVRAGVCDGFIGNRMLRIYRLAVDHMVLDGASPYAVDRALVEFGLPMGPYAVADLAGLDIGYMTRQRLRPTKPAEERWADWADRLHEMGRLGRKTGRGYYIYDDETPRGRPDAEVEALIDAERAEKGITPRSFTDAEIVERYMAAMINEGARILEEGIARRPLDIDMVKIHGYGFPRWRGGPMHHADAVGLDRVLATIRACAQEDAHFWQPAPLLMSLVGEGRGFDSLNED